MYNKIQLHACSNERYNVLIIPKCSYCMAALSYEQDIHYDSSYMAMFANNDGKCTVLQLYMMYIAIQLDQATINETTLLLIIFQQLSTAGYIFNMSLCFIYTYR